MSSEKLLATLVVDPNSKKFDSYGQYHCSDGPARRLVPEGQEHTKDYIINNDDELTGVNIYYWHGVWLPNYKDTGLIKFQIVPNDLVDRLIYKKRPITKTWIKSIHCAKIRRVAWLIYGGIYE